VLQAVGYKVVASASPDTAFEIFAVEQPALVLLDVMLSSSSDGYEVCRRLREFSDVPVIMLTARATEADILKGFDAGADDYLTKPFSAKELIVRVRAVLRRAQRPEEIVSSTVKCGDLEIDFARHIVKARGEPVALTRTEYSLLRELALHPNKIRLHRDLLTAVWGPEYWDDVDYLRAYIRYLRRKLEADPANPRYIVTAPGLGYSLSCPDE